MSRLPDIITRSLDQRKESTSLRELVDNHHLKDFSSNDYLGLAKDPNLQRKILKELTSGHYPIGSTGSRLISGNFDLYEQVEEYLAKIFKSEATLLYNSGYAANQGLLSALGKKGDTILYDQLSHICIKEGAWLSKADSYSFRHNDLEDLERRLTLAQGTIYVATETVFSMDGDIAPLKGIIDLCEEYGAFLIVDEAHTTGCYGGRGGGVLVEERLEHKVFARVYTFGKGPGYHGACVAAEKDTVDFLINFSRSFIYTTSLPPHSVATIKIIFDYITEHEFLQKNLQSKISLFRSTVNPQITGDSVSAIQPVMIAGNERCRAIARELQLKGFDIRAILAPTVKEGSERLRISLHVHNSDEDIDSLANQLNRML